MCVCVLVESIIQNLSTEFNKTCYKLLQITKKSVSYIQAGYNYKRGAVKNGMLLKGE